MPQYQGVWRLQRQFSALPNQQWVTDPQFGNTSLLIQAQNSAANTNNSTLTDSSAATAPIVSSPYVSTGNFTPFSSAAGYWSNAFDTPASYLSLPSVSAFSIATSSTPFTIEGWIRPHAAGGVIFSELYTGAGNPVAIACTMSDGVDTSTTEGLYPAFGYYTGGGWVNGAISTTALSLGVWAHVAFVFNGSACKVFINGVDSTKAGFATSWGNTGMSGEGWNIGRRWDTAGTYYYTGKISNLRFVNGTAVYNANFTPPTAPLTAITNTVLLTCQSSGFIDNSTVGTAITQNGLAAVESYSPFKQLRGPAQVSGGAFLNSAYAQSATGTATAFSNNNFTIECWVYPTAAPTTSWTPIFSIGTSGGGKEIRVAQNINGAGLGFLVPDSGSTSDIYNGYGTLPLYTWSHLALVKYSSTVALYRNGALVGIVGTAFTFNNTGYIYIGADPYASDGFFTGFISQFRITKNQALATGAFTPPTAPLTTTSVGWTGANAASSLTGTVSFLVGSNNPSIYDATNNNAVQTYGTARSSYTQLCNGAPTYVFDSDGAYLYLPPLPGSYIYPADFTVEFFVNPTVNNRILFVFGTETNNRLYVYIDTSNQIYFNLYGIIANAFTGVALTLGVLSHVALVRSGSTLTCYINGVSAGSYTVTNTVGNGPISVGQTWASIGYFVGYIGDFRVSSFARYAANFTPPLAALPHQ